MQTIRQLDALRDALASYRAAGDSVALVPTMGALHAGHMALVDAARRRANRVVVSIFVNPKQFGPNEDLARYPRREMQDARMLTEAGADVLWMPSVEEIYPAGFATTVSVSGVSDILEGAHRAGHFDGVATVVAKLFGQVRPDVALFGEKDFQQLAVIRRMATDLDLGIEVVGVPTQRDDDGLALSSRNLYLDPDERQRAVALPRALGIAARTLEKGGAADEALSQAHDMLAQAGFETDYIALVDAETLGDPVPGHPMRLLAAARIGNTRLIDNVAVLPA
ncbi:MULTISPECIES: pantoate--beta-alanine ligase [Sphingomonas]|uniref:pantoate--beta-alanine ligase n=1 Tax=Sphingomonas TaxID=13687 RepID=UPI000F7D8CCF|nr:pantoate--beta-alanine ligase [Sphingomonas sp. ABOLF]RSV13571.1 pantoate--beta-alanine ligase [Sphingomonas sp. ABOLF]GLK20920.1 pantothenate synthetase [Microbacterium terregens]